MAAARGGAQDWLRERKDDVENSDPWTNRAVLAAMSKLPGEEGKFWIKHKKAALSGLDRIVAARFYDGIYSIGVGGDLSFP